MTDIAPARTPSRSDRHRDGIWIIANRTSGNHDAASLNRIEDRFRAAGRPVKCRFILGEDALPSGADAIAAGIGLVIIFGGDGTISSAAHALSGWDGDILVLPGGTMNLLSRALHGDRDVAQIMEDVLAGTPPPALPVPTVTGDGQCALAGIIAGPTAIWGDVREQARHADLAALASSIPDALSETLAGDTVTIDGVDGTYQAIYMQPSAAGISVRGVLARNTAELIAHGWAWITGDFREGPHVDLGHLPDLTLRSARPMGLLVDGEKRAGMAVMRFAPCRSRHTYLSCLGGAQWP